MISGVLLQMLNKGGNSKLIAFQLFPRVLLLHIYRQKKMTLLILKQNAILGNIFTIYVPKYEMKVKPFPGKY